MSKSLPSKSLTKKILFAFIAFSITSLIVVFITVVADRLAGVLFVKEKTGLIFPPGSSIRYKMSEFDFEANVNSLGFRDYEYSADKGDSYRIITLGDSFTYGWGNNIEDTWSKILEKKLNIDGTKVEVLNLGQAGQYTRGYADIARKAVPVLKPDLIIVAVHQSDDLFQSIHQEDLREPKTLKQAVKGVRNIMYPNFLKLIQFKALKNSDVGNVLKAKAKTVNDRFDMEQKARFDKIDEKIKKMFFDGTLEPGLVRNAVGYPDYYVDVLNLDSPVVQEGIRKMAGDLSIIKATGEKFGATTIIISIPFSGYLCDAYQENLASIGYNTDKKFMTSNKSDEAIDLAAKEAGVGFYQVTDSFRNGCDGERMFYRYDGHFNAYGNKVFAEASYKIVKDKIKKTH